MHPRRIEADEVRLGVGHRERVDRRRLFEQFDRLHQRHAVERADDIARREAIRTRPAADRLASRRTDNTPTRVSRTAAP